MQLMPFAWLRCGSGGAHARRQRRRKSEKPARAPEAAGPEWYAEQQLVLKRQGELALLRPLSSGGGPMQLRRARRKPEPLVVASELASVLAPGPLDTKASSARVRLPP
jgi:hypothetical protein